MDDLFSMGHQALASQPFSTLLGTHLDAFVSGRAEFRLTIRPELLQQHGSQLGRGARADGRGSNRRWALEADQNGYEQGKQGAQA